MLHGHHLTLMMCVALTFKNFMLCTSEAFFPRQLYTCSAVLGVKYNFLQ